MNTGAVTSKERHPYLGFIVAGIFLAIVFAVAAGVWFIFHP